MASQLTEPFANNFARDWVASWNAHDLPRVLAHYTEDFEMNSPFIAQFTGQSSGPLQGKAAAAAYWQAALQRLPGLHFDLLHVLVGASSIVIYYQTSFGLPAAEIFILMSRASCSDPPPTMAKFNFRVGL